MPLFVCDDCGCVENTALGFYWSKDKAMRMIGRESGTCLCSECTPEKFLDGSGGGRYGKWHNRFKKEKWDGIRKVENRNSQ